ncbi:4'-phosphopantetheinyl transferase [Segniliparus rotundus DSM 44985]|uniref:4'-phosphopantetheinyl transferase n=1 Tax=Segniliparus rotundus (strain ATCC BAA-972 / CDC 1076 / CIP 108378 / DSM 44985 / JCM 13578) TaxID=640132 RepID=D6ZEG6_SEGRD|nr:4'-phosphopantetheinyl transferase superfamily protein [Segniliparus rotundus]ADG99442.1 4'-phosphopantetheinyl transferase [Segniliparus rotundus DSM 44985]
MIQSVTTPDERADLPKISDGVFVARADVEDWAFEPVSHRAMERLLDCDYPQWQAARSDEWRAWFAATRHFAKTMVARVADVHIDDVEMRRTTFRRPEFVLRGSGRRPVADANLAHTRSTAVMAVSVRGPIGVDVEAADRKLDSSGFAQAVCHPEELQIYERLGPQARQQMLVRVWTWKEAATKAMGTGLTTQFASLRAHLALAEVIDPRGGRWRVHTLRGGGYQAAVASEARHA